MKKWLIAALLFMGCGNGEIAPVTTNIGAGHFDVYFVNEANAPYEVVQPVLNAVNRQLHEDFGNVWGIDATLVWGNPPQNTKVVYLKKDFTEFSRAIQNNFAGFHRTGAELAYVNFESCFRDGILAQCVGHETMEMLVNPSGSPSGYEVCDPVYRWDQGYYIDGQLMSDFVYPAFYVPGSQGPWDKTGHVKGPFTPAEGGTIFASVPAMFKYHVKQALK